MAHFAPRIHVLLASQANVGLIIRRGPSKCVATILWDRDRDEFQLGQWLKGRIYERRSDLSPDGKYFIYFAMNGKMHTATHGSWTAISKAPYLKAISLFPWGDCWLGGGLWTSPTTYWLNDLDDSNRHPSSIGSTEVLKDREFKRDRLYGSECKSVYYHRLIRDGWSLISFEKSNGGSDKTIFEKQIGHGWTLRKYAMSGVDHPIGSGSDWDVHELVQQEKKLTIPCHKWEWADLDRDRLVWASDGCLRAAQIEPSGLVNEVELSNFNDMTFSHLIAPY